MKFSTCSFLFVSKSSTINYISFKSCFFSSRRRHTRSLRDWSSDVCSSDLGVAEPARAPALEAGGALAKLAERVNRSNGEVTAGSEERRVGKEGRCRWSP